MSTSSDDPLDLLDLEPLDENQLALIAQLWEPFRFGNGPWPIWGWVRSEFENTHRASALRTLASLPTMCPAHAGWSPYKLYWQEKGHSQEPGDDEKIGLSIAGMIYLARTRDGMAEAVVDRFVTVLRDLGHMERGRSFTPTSVPKSSRPFEMFVGDLPIQSLRKRFSVSVDDVAEVITREYGHPAVLFRQGETWIVQFEGHRMHPDYASLMNGDDYLRLIARLDEAQHQETPLAPPLLPPALWDSGPEGASEWREIDSRIRRLVGKVADAENLEDWNAIGLACIAILEELSKWLAMVSEGVAPRGAAKEWIPAFFEQKGMRDETAPVVQAAWKLAERVKHGTSTTEADAFAAAQATVMIARTLQRAYLR